MAPRHRRLLLSPEFIRNREVGTSLVSTGATITPWADPMSLVGRSGFPALEHYITCHCTVRDKRAFQDIRRADKRGTDTPRTRVLFHEAREQLRRLDELR